ncbi:lysozyme [Hafnia sp. HMSC23F03]|uniref:lysozyme n=1 Tax=Hafnia sp. HMSC23F03 TaxID=1581059 RepID=UPI0008A512BA|nr:lysozyme [Hafnia sp. HMSC23F03]OFS12427.1 lysozyme [Hafnia sp. HMSC23F03]
MGTKTKLSAAVLALILGGATADKILDQFLDEKEGVRTIAYQDGRGIWSICRGLTRIEGKPVTQGLKLSYSQCKRYDAVERDKAIAWVKRNVIVPLSEPAIAGIASFCPYNIGPAKCFPSTFYKKLNAGDRIGACAEIKRWIFDGGRDCRIKANNCAGQPVRRGQESELTCWDIDK